MNVLLAGHFKYSFYEEAMVESLERLGNEVETFTWKDDFKIGIGRLEMAFTFPLYKAFVMNLKLVTKVINVKPEVIIVFRGTLVFPNTVKFLKTISGGRLISFNNDDPFSPKYKDLGFRASRLWWLFRRTIKYYDINWVYRPHNISDYVNAGSRKTVLLPPYYLPGTMPDIGNCVKKYDLIFIGHYTVDRLEILNFLIERDIDVIIYGTNWPEGDLSEKYKYNRTIRPIYGKEYFREISNSKAAIAFLSKLNRDVYTRRNFEIPLCQTCMISEWSKELEEYFVPDVEAIFFRNKLELLDKINLANLEQIGLAGYGRVLTSGYDIDSRVKSAFDESLK